MSTTSATALPGLLDAKAAPEIYDRLSKVMGKIGAVSKDRKNPQQGYQFRGIDDFYNACHSALVFAGVVPVPRVMEQARVERQTKSGATMFHVVLTVATRFYAPDGSFVEAITIGEAMDTSDKASNKAMSAAMKYALIETFCIPTDDDSDTENHHLEPTAPTRGVGRPTPASAPSGGQRPTSQPPPSATDMAPPAPDSPGEGLLQGRAFESAAGAGISEEEQMAILLDEATSPDAVKHIGERAKEAGFAKIYEASRQKYRRLTKGAA